MRQVPVKNDNYLESLSAYDIRVRILILDLLLWLEYEFQFKESWAIALKTGPSLVLGWAGRSFLTEQECMMPAIIQKEEKFTGIIILNTQFLMVSEF